MRVFDPCIDFCGFDTAYIYAVSNAQKIYIRSPSNRDNFIPKSEYVLKGLPIHEHSYIVDFHSALTSQVSLQTNLQTDAWWVGLNLFLKKVFFGTP